ncbi:hypothetical protein [uncultured Roseibium sp.]|uniref:hypothetical protein n=1 Tax=uncultured Roseibium sp. TaxID=1936171 RepID=UPI0026234936|nr:hypothetical protein [uncultured Roseibium sp.]
METKTNKDGPKPDSSDLERRVLAHERILQSVIAYMSRSEPRFVEHLKARFVDTMSMARREQDYRGVDDYAEEFIHAAMQQGDICTGLKLKNMKPEKASKPSLAKLAPETMQVPPENIGPERVRVHERNGIWEVRVDGAFLGNYHKSEHARAAAAVARFTLK